MGTAAQLRHALAALLTHALPRCVELLRGDGDGNGRRADRASFAGVRWW
jgi:hypothetical protein